MQEQFGTYPMTQEEAEARKKAYEEKKEKERLEGAGKFRLLAIPTLIYALITTICLYDNFGGITMPFFAVATIGYILFIAKKMEEERKPGWIFYAGGMLCLAVSDTLTANTGMQFLNNFMICILIMGMVLYLFCKQNNWSITKYIGAYFLAFFGGIGSIADFFSDGIAAKSTGAGNGKKSTGVYVGIGILLFIPLGMVVTALLMSADAVFSNMIGDFWKVLFRWEDLYFVPLFFIFVYLAAYCGMRYVGKHEISEQVPAKRDYPATIINTILTLTTLIYLLFSGIQIFSLFLGKMTLPNNYTYAQYAREGFFQLIFVCFLNLCIVLFANGCFQEHTYTKILLMGICGCTCIMLASAGLRLYMYICAYHLTVSRIIAAWAIAVIAVSMVFIMISVFKKDLKLMHCLTFVATVAVFVLTISRPEAIVASYNLSHINEETSFYDLSCMSADAANAIASYEKTLGEENTEKKLWIEDYKQDNRRILEKKNSILAYNFSLHGHASYFITDQEATSLTLVIRSSNVYSVSFEVNGRVATCVEANGEYFFEGEEIFFDDFEDSDFQNGFLNLVISCKNEEEEVIDTCTYYLQKGEKKVMKINEYDQLEGVYFY